MFFEKERISCNILDVLELNQENINTFNHGRNFNAISFRLHSDTFFKTDYEEYHMIDNTVSFVPAKLDYTRVSRIDELIVIHFDTLDYHTDQIDFFTPENPRKIELLFREILNCWKQKKTSYLYRCTALLYEILSECHAQNFKPIEQASKIQNSVAYISENYSNKYLTIPEIAKRSFISEVYFRKLFKEEYGISPKQYIIELRIQNAIHLISTGYYSLKEISELSGYCDYKHFSTEFKRITGISPSKYSSAHIK